MFRRWPRFDRFAFPAAVLVGLLAFSHFALPFAVKPGPLALNYVENTPRISSGGMPTAAQIAAIADAGFDVVVNLAPPDAIGSHEDEQGLVARHGKRYFSVPVDFAAPQREDFERFARILRDNRDKRVLVHCQLSLRASSFVYLYRVIELGEDTEKAFEDVARVWQPADQWRAFMRDTLEARGKSLPMELDS